MQSAIAAKHAAHIGGAAAARLKRTLVGVLNNLTLDKGSIWRGVAPVPCRGSLPTRRQPDPLRIPR